MQTPFKVLLYVHPHLIYRRFTMKTNTLSMVTLLAVALQKFEHHIPNFASYEPTRTCSLRIQFYNNNGFVLTWGDNQNGNAANIIVGNCTATNTALRFDIGGEKEKMTNESALIHYVDNTHAWELATALVLTAINYGNYPHSSCRVDLTHDDVDKNKITAVIS